LFSKKILIVKILPEWGTVKIEDCSSFPFEDQNLKFCPRNKYILIWLGSGPFSNVGADPCFLLLHNRDLDPIKSGSFFLQNSV